MSFWPRCLVNNKEVSNCSTWGMMVCQDMMVCQRDHLIDKCQVPWGSCYLIMSISVLDIFGMIQWNLRAGGSWWTAAAISLVLLERQTFRISWKLLHSSCSLKLIDFGFLVMMMKCRQSKVSKERVSETWNISTSPFFLQKIHGFSATNTGFLQWILSLQGILPLGESRWFGGIWGGKNEA